MPDMDQMIEKLKSMPIGLVQFMEKWLRKLPAVRHEIDSKTANIIRDLESSVKPYEGKFNTYYSLPSEGQSHEKILSDIEEITTVELIDTIIQTEKYVIPKPVKTRLGYHIILVCEGRDKVEKEKPKAPLKPKTAPAGTNIPT